MTEFYQVIVWFGNATVEPSLSLLDLSKKQVRKNFVKPYNSGSKIFSHGAVHDLSKVSQVWVLRTASSVFELTKLDDEQINKRDIERNARSKGFKIFTIAGTQPWESARRHGEDVTTNFISGPPGESSFIWRALNSPWTLTAATLAATAALAYFNLA